MIHLPSYHSNGLPAKVWQNQVNLIGEKVYKPKIHFCEHCNKPILVYGRLIPCKHVFCFTCATLCATQQHQHQHQQQSISKPQNTTATLLDIDESTSNTSLINLQQDATNSPILSGSSSISGLSQAITGKGCFRCRSKALRIERNTLNSIHICQFETCRRTYLSARDLQAHVSHRHSRHKKTATNNNNVGMASIAAISSSPYISSSTLMHLNNHSTTIKHNNRNLNNPHNHHHSHKHSSSSSITAASNATNPSNNINSPSLHDSPMRTPSHYPRSDKDHIGNHNHNQQQHHNHHHFNQDHGRLSIRDRDRHRERDAYARSKEGKEHQRQSLQRAAQWAEASAQIMEKGLTR